VESGEETLIAATRSFILCFKLSSWKERVGENEWKFCLNRIDKCFVAFSEFATLKGFGLVYFLSVLPIFESSSNFW